MPPHGFNARARLPVDAYRRLSPRSVLTPAKVAANLKRIAAELGVRARPTRWQKTG
jgi:hypothetical protein